jgi:uncharacterized radical SAM protein YgiQ
VILITGDAYVDHPSYGAAVIGRVLEAEGFRVGIIAQPDWKSPDQFTALGRPRLFFGITAGNLDSMVANYTANKRRRQKDDYSPGGKSRLRPDRPTIVYANRVREAFGDIPVVIGGIEASLRRFAHYDWWDNDVRRSLLLDSRADILVYGMGETQVLEIASRLNRGADLWAIPGTAVIGSEVTAIQDCMEIPSYEEVKESKAKFGDAFRLISLNQDPFSGKILAQKHGPRYVIQFPPPAPMEEKQLDRIYELPYARAWHPGYDKDGGVPGFETVRFSLISHRGCCGECSFCSLSMHQGRIIQSRSTQSILREALKLAEGKDFKGTITDVGGPTANLYKTRCSLWEGKGACRNRHCLTPERCGSLKPGYKESLRLLQALRSLPGVKHVFLESGLRYDLLTDAFAEEYLENLCQYHVSGQLKVAPEHSADRVLRIMNKPAFGVYDTFARKFRDMNRKVGKDQYLVHYFISAHPGSTLADTLELSLELMKRKVYPEQIQDFMPLPLTLSGTVYYTGTHPLTGKEVYVPRSDHERRMHRALIQYRNPENAELVKEALTLLKKENLLARFLPRGKISYFQSSKNR